MSLNPTILTLQRVRLIVCFDWVATSDPSSQFPAITLLVGPLTDG
jgi:hypothetical protein